MADTQAAAAVEVEVTAVKVEGVEAEVLVVEVDAKAAPAPEQDQEEKQEKQEPTPEQADETASEKKQENEEGEKKPKSDKRNGKKREKREKKERPEGPAHFEDADGLFKTICRTFMNGRCKRDACRYVHDASLCASFWKTGACEQGDACGKNHFVTVPPPAEAGAASGEVVDKKKKDRKKKDPKKKDPKKDKKVEAEDGAAGSDEYGDSGKGGKGKNKTQKKKKNTEVFEPTTKPVDLRITYDLGSKDDAFSTALTSRDVVLVPNLFSDFKKGELYGKLVQELEECGIPRDRLLKMWHGNDKIDGTHLIVDDRSSWKSKCPTFDLITDRLQQFFKLSIKATRFNWYVDTSQWKPFHFDAAAVKPEIAAKQNFTVGISFGATRDAAFEHAQTKTTISVPQPDGCVYAFARDTNVIWRHGILQDVPVRQEGRISVIAWGWVDGMTEPEAVVPTAPVLDQKVIGKKQ
jgi:hypothetical protein